MLGEGGMAALETLSMAPLGPLLGGGPGSPQGGGGHAAAQQHHAPPFKLTNGASMHSDTYQTRGDQAQQPGDLRQHPPALGAGTHGGDGSMPPLPSPHAGALDADAAALLRQATDSCNTAAYQYEVQVGLVGTRGRRGGGGRGRARHPSPGGGPRGAGSQVGGGQRTTHPARAVAAGGARALAGRTRRCTRVSVALGRRRPCGGGGGGGRRALPPGGRALHAPVLADSGATSAQGQHAPPAPTAPARAACNTCGAGHRTPLCPQPAGAAAGVAVLRPPACSPALSPARAGQSSCNAVPALLTSQPANPLLPPPPAGRRHGGHEPGAHHAGDACQRQPERGAGGSSSLEGAPSAPRGCPPPSAAAAPATGSCIARPRERAGHSTPGLPPQLCMRQGAIRGARFNPRRIWLCGQARPGLGASALPWRANLIIVHPASPRSARLRVSTRPCCAACAHTQLNMMCAWVPVPLGWPCGPTTAAAAWGCDDDCAHARLRPARAGAPHPACQRDHAAHPTAAVAPACTPPHAWRAGGGHPHDAAPSHAEPGPRPRR